MTQSKLISAVALLVSSVLALGCAADDEEIGGNEPEPTEPEGESDPAGVVGNWRGYVQACTFEDGSDTVWLTVDQTGQGSIRFGDAAPLPPATDPAAFYPPPKEGETIDGDSDLTVGFEFPLYDLVLDPERLRGGFLANDVLADWCALQTPQPTSWPGTGYSCTGDPGVGITLNVSEDECYLGDESQPEGDRIYIPCVQAVMCQGCTCFAESCQVTRNCGFGESCEGGLPTEFDDRIDVALGESQQTLTGTLVLDEETYTVHLERQ